MKNIVGAGRSATEFGFVEGDEVHAGDCAEEVEGLGDHVLTMMEVTSGMIGDAEVWESGGLGKLCGYSVVE